MGFFDDPFEDIIKEFFEGPRRRARREQFIRGEDEERIIDFIEDEKNIYLIFELPGYYEEDISIKVRDGMLEIKAEKKRGENIQDYLHQKLEAGVFIKKRLPSIVDVKKMDYKINNGVLEISFKKRKK